MEKLYRFQTGRGPQVNASEDYDLHVLYGQNAMLYRLDNGGNPDVAVIIANSSARSTSITTGTANVYSIFEIRATTSEVKFVVGTAGRQNGIMENYEVRA